MSDQYQDALQYSVYFVLGASLGAYVAIRWEIDASPWWAAPVISGLLGGLLAVLFGDRFWNGVKKFFTFFH
jgi:hypothetical protein